MQCNNNWSGNQLAKIHEIFPESGANKSLRWPIGLVKLSFKKKLVINFKDTISIYYQIIYLKYIYRHIFIQHLLSMVSPDKRYYGETAV